MFSQPYTFLIAKLNLEQTLIRTVHSVKPGSMESREILEQK